MSLMPPEVLTRETPILERHDIPQQKTADIETHVLRVRLDILTAFTIHKFEDGTALLSVIQTDGGLNAVQTLGQLGVKLSMDGKGTITATQISRRKDQDWRDIRSEEGLSESDIERVLEGIFETANWSAIPSSHLQY